MVAFSNDGLSIDCVKKRLSENGYQSLHFCDTPKYKVQKVWAVRDFPPGCGRDALNVDLNHKENLFVPICENMADAVEAHGGNGLGDMEENEESDKLGVNLLPKITNVMNNAVEEPKSHAGPLRFELSKDLESSEMALPEKAKVIQSDEVLMEVDGERNSLLVENVVSVNKNHVLHPGSDTDGAIPVCDVKTLSPLQWPIKNGSVEDSILPLPKNNYHDRRVFAVRDFPPFTGRNAPKPTEQDHFDGTEASREVVVHGLMAEPYCPWRQAGCDFSLGHELVRPIVQGLMAEPCCPWRQGKQTSVDAVPSRNQAQKPKMYCQKISKAAARKSIPKRNTPQRPVRRKRSGIISGAVEGCSGAVVMVDVGTCGALVARNGRACSLNWQALPEDSPTEQGQCEFDVTLPPCGRNSSSCSDARSKVRETLRRFQSIYRKILRGEESNSRPGEVKPKQKDKMRGRIDLQASNFIKKQGKEVNTGQPILGEVPGVEVGDAFQYRVELALVGVHRLYQAGIDSMTHGGMLVAISIVASGAYDDDLGDADELIYSGQGGNVTCKDKAPEDQKLVKGNLALKNSIGTRNPVRVIRGSKETRTSESKDGRATLVTTYVYDGLYTVDNYWTERGPHGKMVFMFKLVRIPGQPELVWKEVKSSKMSKVRLGVCVSDITEGRESLPITAVNTIDGEKPPPFKYIRKMKYPDSFYLAPPKGCDCVGRCSDAKRCSCAVKNGGEIPYNRNGAIVEVKPLVYECGPSCGCSPSCYNRVSQHGIKIPLEIFKTDKRGWGVRALTSISSGTFICEYAGELLDDREAERRIGSDEYLFDIGQNYNDCTVNSVGQSNPNGLAEEGGYTIDAARYGNIGRFINHSCSPNLYAQNVVYDHKDKKMPHIMLFAADNIPPLKELTYHYNYSVDQVYDSDGNVKVKKCFCGSSDCTGRMY